MENRDLKTGKFIKGNKASPGRRSKAQELAILANGQEFFNQADGNKTKGQRIFDAIYKIAFSNSALRLQALALLLKYGCIMPTQKIEQSIDITQKDVKEFAINIATFWKEKHPDGKYCGKNGTASSPASQVVFLNLHFPGPCSGITVYDGRVCAMMISPEHCPPAM